MGNRFNVRIPVNEDAAVKAVEAAHVKEITEKDFEAEVIAATVPVALEFYGKDSEACETLAPRFAAVAERFAGKVRFLKVAQRENTVLAAKLGVTASPTIVFLQDGLVKGEPLSGDVKRTDIKARVEAMLGTKPASALQSAPVGGAT